MVIESIKDGLKLANNNFQLVLVRIAVKIICLVLFLVFLGVPLFVAVISMGLDIASARDLLPHVMNNPSEILTRYLGLAFLLAGSIIFYLFIISIFYLYILGGTLGVLKNSALNIQYRFNMRSFFSESRRHFWPLFRLISILLAGFILVLIVFSVGGGITALLTSQFAGSGSTLGVFLNSFILLSVITIAAIVFFAGVIFYIYSVLVTVIEETGAMDSMRKAAAFLRSNPRIFLLYIALIVGIVIVNIVLILLKMPFGLIPLIGTIMNIMISIIGALIQSYLVIVVWSSLIVYYMKERKHLVSSGAYEI